MTGRLERVLSSAAILAGLLLAPCITLPSEVSADQIDVTGEVVGADVEGTIWLSLDPGGGPVTGRIEMTVMFDCRGKARDERHVMELAEGSIDGDRLVATAVYVERAGLPKVELSRCKSAYETYQTREDSRRLIGTVDADGQRATGTIGEYRPTVTWHASWQPPEPPAEAATEEEAVATP